MGNSTGVDDGDHPVSRIEFIFMVVLELEFDVNCHEVVDSEKVVMEVVLTVSRSRNWREGESGAEIKATDKLTNWDSAWGCA
jgi:hypothetical protein